MPAENLHLQPGELLRLGQILVSDVRLLPDDPQAAAGHIHQDPIHGALPLRNRLPGVLEPGVYAGKAHPGRSLFHKGQLMLVDVAGNEISLPCHIDGRSEALAPWSSAAVQDLHPGFTPAHWTASREAASWTLKKDKPLNAMAITGGRMISMEEAGRFANGFDDPARLSSAFAGVAGDVGTNAVAIRGNSPQFTQWRLEGVEIPNPTHFADLTGLGGGFLSALSTQVIGNSDFYNGAFPSEYSNALSGVFDMQIRNGNNQTIIKEASGVVVGEVNNIHRNLYTKKCHFPWRKAIPVLSRNTERVFPTRQQPRARKKCRVTYMIPRISMYARTKNSKADRIDSGIPFKRSVRQCESV